MSAKDQLAGSLAINAAEAERLGSPFYASLCRSMADDALAGGPIWRLLGQYADKPVDAYYAFRLLGGAHRMVLDGQVPELAKHYGSVGGDGDAKASWLELRKLLEAKPATIVGYLDHPLQTNEVARSGALVGGFLTIAEQTGLPLRLLELGSSAGLNLRFDKFSYESGTASVGPADSPVKFKDYWLDGIPPFNAPLQIASRNGCDERPIDASTQDGQQKLLSYLWPDEADRIELLRGALEIAAKTPAQIDKAEIPPWVAKQLNQLPAGEASVVFHSIVWLYLSERDRQTARDAIFEAGSRATNDNPLAWLRFEESKDLVICELRLTLWPSGEERLLARGMHHLSPVTWLG